LCLARSSGARVRSAVKIVRIVLVIALLAVGVGAVGFVLTGNSRNTNATSQYLTATATHRDVANSAVADGSVSAATSYALAFEIGRASCRERV